MDTSIPPQPQQKLGVETQLPAATPQKPSSRIVLFIAGTALLVTAIVYLGYQNWQLKQQVSRLDKIIQVDNTPSGFSSPTPIPDPTANQVPDGNLANWKTYVSSNNYQVRYPSDWFIKNVPSGFSLKQGTYKIIFTFPSGFGPGICIFSDSQDFNKNDPNDPISMASKCLGKYVEIKGEGFTFRRREIPNTSPEGKQNGQWTIYVKDKSGNFVTVPPIAYEIPINNYDASTIILMDQILSTFKFLEQTADTSGWKIYSNSQYGFQFQYPPDAKLDILGTSPNEQYKVIYMGKKQIESGRTQTDLADGYIFYISIRGDILQSTVDSVSQRTYAGAKENCYEQSTFSTITSTIVDGRPAKTYDVRDCLGDYTEIFVSNGKKVFEITQFYVGKPPDQDKYKNITIQVLSTFKFTPN